MTHPSIYKKINTHPSVHVSQKYVYWCENTNWRLMKFTWCRGMEKRGATSSGDGGGSCHASSVRCVVCWEGSCRFNHKIMIKVQESPPSIMVTRNLWSVRVWVRDWLCKRKTHHPQCTLPKVSCIVVWLFF